MGIDPANSMRVVAGTSPVVFTRKDSLRGQSNLVFDWLIFYLVPETSRTNSTREGTAKFHGTSP